MSSLFNLIWFILGGWVLGLFWLLWSGLFYITVIGAPVGRAFLEFAKLSICPFGKRIIRETELKGPDNVGGLRKTLYLVLNTLWFIFGICITVVYFALGIISFVTIIGIPVGIVYIRMGKFILFPIGARVVSKKQAIASSVANEIEMRSKL